MWVEVGAGGGAEAVAAAAAAHGLPVLLAKGVELPPGGGARVLREVDGGLVRDGEGRTVAEVLRVGAGGDGLARAEASVERRAQEGGGGTFLLDFGSGGDSEAWKVIPMENMVAARGGLDGVPSISGDTSGVSLLARCASAAEAEAALGALEAGADGVVLRPGSPGELEALLSALPVASGAETGTEGTGAAELDGSRAGERLELETVEITGVESVGVEALADRACVDLTEAMGPGEGLLVGSFARCLFLVHSEREETAYINARPFRVNAGPIHAYCLGPEGRTAYLSELASGSKVEVLDWRGRRREGVVGRVKIERRQCLLVTARPTEDASTDVSVMLQNAETVRLIAPGGEPVPVTELRPGDRVLVHRPAAAARHAGRAVAESCVER